MLSIARYVHRRPGLHAFLVANAGTVVFVLLRVALFDFLLANKACPPYLSEILFLLVGHLQVSVVIAFLAVVVSYIFALVWRRMRESTKVVEFKIQGNDSENIRTEEGARWESKTSRPDPSVGSGNINSNNRLGDGGESHYEADSSDRKQGVSIPFGGGRCWWLPRKTLFVSIVALTWACAAMCFAFIHIIALPNNARLGNFLSHYAKHVSKATYNGKAVLFTLPFTGIFSEDPNPPSVIRRLPHFVQPAWYNHDLGLDADIRAHLHTHPHPPSFCENSHERKDSAMWAVLPIMRAVLRKAFGLVQDHTHGASVDVIDPLGSPSAQFVCTMHYRLDDLLLIDDQQYVVVQYSWYRHLLRDHSHPPCTQITLLSTIFDMSRISTLSHNMIFKNRTIIAMARDAELEIFQKIVSLLYEDFPLAKISARYNGTLNDDLHTMVTSDLLLGSSSTLSFWAAVATTGIAYLPRSQLFHSNQAVLLRGFPNMLKIVEAQVVTSGWLHSALCNSTITAIVDAVAVR